MSQPHFFQTQFRERLADIVAKAEHALSDAYAVQLARYREPEKVVERLNAILKRCTLIRSLLVLPTGVREFNELLRNEIDFVRSAELFLDEMGILRAPQESSGQT